MAWDSTKRDLAVSRLVTALEVDEAEAAFIELMVDDAVVAFMNVTGLSDVPDEAEPLIRKLVTIGYNKRGSEGLGGESYSGVGQDFIDDLPADIKRELFGFRKVVF